MSSAMSSNSVKPSLLLPPLLLHLFSPSLVRGQARLLVVVEKTEREQQQILTDKLTSGSNVDIVVQQIDHYDEEGGMEQACRQLQQREFTGVIDLTWGGWRKIQNISETHGMGYFKVDSSSHQFLQAGEAFLRSRGALDAALIFASEEELDKSLFWIIAG